MVDGVHPEVPAQVGHATGFQLEHRDRRAPAQQLETGLVIERDLRNIKVWSVPVDQLHRIVDHRQGLQPEEVHLQHSQFRQGTHGELGHHFIRIAPGEG